MTKITTVPAEVVLLKEEDSRAFNEYLDGFTGFPYLLSESVLAGTIGVRSDLLERAAKTAYAFHTVCRALHAEIQSDTKLNEQMMRALSPLPVVRETLMNDPFCLQYMRMDFFLEGDALRIIEVNSGGGGLTDYVRCTRYLQKHFDFSPPKGFKPLEVEHMLRTITDYAQKVRPEMKTIGLGASENGSTDELNEYLEYARWIHENTDLEPVLLELNKGVLSFLDYKDQHLGISSLSELDAVLVDWFEDLPCLERVEMQLRENDVLLVPPRSDLLFENKHFLSLLQKIEKPRGVDDDDWELLQSALLPSFPVEELDKHIDEMKAWHGCVLKMDIDCASENVFLYDFSKTSLEEACAEILKRHSERSEHSERSRRATWTIQKLIYPPHLPMNGQSTPEWVDYEYEPFKWDLMTYLCMHEHTPHILFGSREFSTEKIDDLTKEGRDDNIFSTVCAV